MSTHCHIGFVNDDDTILASYCHFDGYPSHIIMKLIQFLEKHSIEKFIKRVTYSAAHSGFSSWHENGGECLSERSIFHTEVIDRKYLCEEYAYLLSAKTGQISEFYTSGILTPVSVAYNDANIDYVPIKCELYVQEKNMYDRFTEMLNDE